ncbi:MAG: AAA family ATPase [Ktedonobacteraceae bacterium]
MSTTTTTFTVSQEQDRFTPSTHQVIHIAQREAARMDATSVEPEHLLLAIIMQGDERAMNVLGRMGINVQTVRARATELSQASADRAASHSDLPLSKEAQKCIDWALAFISLMHTASIFPDHLSLGVLRHPRTQPLLAFLLPSQETLQTRLAEVIEPAYTSYIDQLIYTQVRDQSIIYYGRGPAQRILRKFERPPVVFMDVLGLVRAKRELRDVVEFLKATPTFQLTGGKFPRGVLLTGSTGNDKRLLAQATAGEAVVPLITFSMQALLEVLVDLEARAISLEDLAMPGREYHLFTHGDLPEKGRSYLRYLFQEAQDVSPSILYIEDIDALARLERHDPRRRILHQLEIEMDGLDKHYRTVVIAGTNRPDKVSPSLLASGRFEGRVDLGYSAAEASMPQRHFCLACKRDIDPDWQHCVYCGFSLAYVCSQCGSAYPELEGVRFCPSCGSALA